MIRLDSSGRCNLHRLLFCYVIVFVHCFTKQIQSSTTLWQKSCVGLTGKVRPLPSTGRTDVFVLVFILFLSETLLRVKGFQDGWSDPTKCLMCCCRKQKFPLVPSDGKLDSLFPSSLIPALFSSKEISAFCVIFKTGRNGFSLFLSLSLKAKLERTF